MVNVNVNVKVNTNVKCFVDKYSEITSTWLDLKQNQYEKLNYFLSKGRERERELHTNLHIDKETEVRTFKKKKKKYDEKYMHRWITRTGRKDMHLHLNFYTQKDGRTIIA